MTTTDESDIRQFESGFPGDAQDANSADNSDPDQGFVPGDPGDLMDVTNAPCQPVLWRLMVQPLKPRECSVGGIILPEEARKAEQYLTCIGRIERMGGLAFKAETKAGLNLAHEPNRPEPGMWVVFGQYAGQKLWVGETEYRVLNDTEILAVTDTPEAFRNYV